APATLLISQRRRRRLHVSQTPNHAGGHPYRTPPREYVQERLDQVAAAAARCVGVSIDRSWLKDLNVEHIVKWVYRMLVRIAFDALLIGLVLPLLPGVQFAGTAGTAIGLAALYNLCLVGCALVLSLIFMLVKVLK